METRVSSKGKIIEATKVFSFRCWKEEVEYWREYAAVRGVTVDYIASTAMREYIKNNPLSEIEMTLYLKRKGEILNGDAQEITETVPKTRRG